VVAGGGLFFGNQQQVAAARDPVPLKAKEFAAQPFDAVSHHSAADPARYGDPQSSRCALPRCKTKDEMGILDAPSRPRKSQKIPALQQPVGPRKAEPGVF